jgi:acyl-CoA dehydrogenase
MTVQPALAPRQLRIAANTAPTPPSLAERAERVAVIAAQHAAIVDRDAVFPLEAIAAARRERLLGAAAPRELGGEGASISEVADICYALGRACGSTAMIFAMHQTKFAAVVRHGRGSAWHQNFLRRVSSEQLLLASSTTEGNRGGDIRNSAAPIKRNNTRIALQRDASVIPMAKQPTRLSPPRAARPTRRVPTRF